MADGIDDLHQEERLGLDTLAEEYQRRHGVAIEFIKSMVGAGEEYSNAAARAVVSPNGAWFECVDLPMEFSGTAGAPVTRRFVDDAEAVRLLTGLNELASHPEEGVRNVGLFALYTRRGILDGRGVWAVQADVTQDSGARPVTVGAFRPGVLPLVFRCRVDSDREVQGLGIRRGVVFCLAGVGERCLVVEMPHEGVDVRDLGTAPGSPVRQ